MELGDIRFQCDFAQPPRKIEHLTIKEEEINTAPTMFKTTNEKINLLTGKGRDKVYEGAPPLKSKWVNRILRKESQREIP